MKLKRLTLMLAVLSIAVFSIAPAGCGNDSGVSGGNSDGDSDGDGDGDADGDSDGDADDIDFSNNIFPSPAPPGNLTPENAPQIVVFGWDDCMFSGDHPNDTTQASDNAMNFVHTLLGDITNPDGSDASTSFFVNGAYLPNTEEGGPWGSETDYMLAAGNELLSFDFEIGNHTFDHLEINGTWGGIPEAWNDGSLGGWTDSAGTLMDYDTWMNTVIDFNHNFILSSYPSVDDLYGFRAPRLEINDEGLKALKDYGYLYDVNMEEGNQWEYVTAAVMSGADNNGFDWIVWPHTLDNGSPGVWQSQDFGEKGYLEEYPSGLFENPVYMIYVPDNGLQETIADRMKTEITSEDTDWVGDKVREMTAFDFNTFLYARLTKAEWLEVMQYNFKLRYNGNRVPLTFGAHPAEFSWRYDNEVVLLQPGNEDFHDVLNYNTYQDRKEALSEFVAWIQTNYGDDVWFMNHKQLVEYMQNPFDKDGNPVEADTLASPTCDNFFSLAGEWSVDKDSLGSDASVNIVDGNTIEIDFTVGTNDVDGDDYCWVDIATYFSKGAFSNVSHIDIVYETEAPFRIRLLPDPSESEISMQALVAGVNGEHKARIRMKDFRPDPYASADDIASHDHVNSTYLSKVAGISIENASTIDQISYSVKIKQIRIHGLASTGMKVASPEGRASVFETGEIKRTKVRSGSSAFWPKMRD